MKPEVVEREVVPFIQFCLLPFFYKDIVSKIFLYLTNVSKLANIFL
jgi:hypothetical protein